MIEKHALNSTQNSSYWFSSWGAVGARQTGSPLLIRADLRGTLSFKKHIHYYNFVFKNKQTNKQKRILGNSLVVQWLGLGAFTELAQELRSYMPRGATQKKKKNPNYNNASKSNVTKS